MNYGLFYKQVDFNRHSTAVVKNAIANENLKWNPGKLQNHQTEIKDILT